MSDLPELCVIIPCYNRAGLLRVTLQNILNQSYTPSEIVVIDDHSTDHIAQVIAEFEGQVKFVTNTGKGPGAARNLGMALTKAPYIQFFDSDDLITGPKLEAQMKAIVEANADMAYGPYVMATESETGWQQTDVIMQASPLPDNNLAKWMLRGWNILTQACIFKRSFLKTVPPWDEELVNYEDHLYLTLAALQNPRIVHVPQGGVLYRQHGQQSTASHTKNLHKIRDRIQALERIRTHFDSSKLDLLTGLVFKGRCWEAHRSLIEATGESINSKNNGYYAYQFKRFRNKFERFLTKSDWERMHGINANPSHFDLLIGQLT